MKNIFSTHKKAEVAQPAIVPVTPEFLTERMVMVLQNAVNELRLLQREALYAGHFNTESFIGSLANHLHSQSQYDYFVRADQRESNLINSVQENA